MKIQNFLILFLFLLTLSFCINDKESSINSREPLPLAKPKMNDTIKVVYQLDVVDSTITNTTDKKVDVLINNSRGFLRKSADDIKRIYFNKDYVFSNNVEVYNDNLLFEEQVIITPEHILYLDKNGKEELYIIGIRNCSQELIILRVRE